ncbi:MAG: hypothetical protein J1E79_06620 [Rikenella sp.]|nr:hypothetical protein [Rikenella sp.]
MFGRYGGLLLLSAILAGCQVSKTGLEGIESLFADKETQQIEAKPTLIRSEDLLGQGYLTCVDSLLLVSANRGERMVTVYNLHTGEVVNRLAPKGKANGEFLLVGDLAQLDGRVMILGKMPTRAAWIDKQLLLDSFPKMETTDLAFEGGDYLSVAPVAGGRYVATGRFDAPESQRHQFAWIGADGKIVSTFEDYLLTPELEGLPNYNLAYGYQGRFATTPDGRHGLYCGWESAVWRFYDFSGREPRKVAEYALVLPSFRPRDGAHYGVVHSEERSIGGSIFAVASDSLYYLLFSDKPYGAYSAYFTDRIFVFDLSGRPVRKIELDREIIAMAYWAEQHALLGCANDAEGEPQILRFDL